MKRPLTEKPGKLRPSAAQINALVAESKRRIWSSASWTSDVEKLDVGSLKTAIFDAGVGAGVGGDAGVVGELPQPNSPATIIGNTIAITIRRGSFGRARCAMVSPSAITGLRAQPTIRQLVTVRERVGRAAGAEGREERSGNRWPRGGLLLFPF